MGLIHVYVQDILNTTMVIVLQVLFHYEIIYEMGPPMSENQLKSPSPVPRSLSLPRRGQGRDIQPQPKHFQLLAPDVSSQLASLSITTLPQWQVHYFNQC